MSLENDRKKCPQCGKLNDAKNKFCSHCFSLIDENFDSDSITIELKKPEKVSNGTADEEKGAKTEEEIKTEEKETEDEITETEKSESEEEKPKVNKQKVFAEFFKQYKNNKSPEESLEFVSQKMDLELSTLNKWYANDQWLKKADGLIKLKEKRDNVLDELLQLDWYTTSKEEAFELVSKKLRISTSKIEKWYEKHNWEAEIQSKQERLDKIKEEKHLKIKAEKEKKQKEKQLLE